MPIICNCSCSSALLNQVVQIVNIVDADETEGDLFDPMVDLFDPMVDFLGCIGEVDDGKIVKNV